MWHRLSHWLWRHGFLLAGRFSSHIAPLADRHRDPSRGQAGPPAGDRPRHGRGDRRDRRDRRRLLPVPPGHLGVARAERRQAAPDGRQQRHHRRRRQGAGADHGRRQCPGRLQRGGAGAGAGRHHGGRHPGPPGRSQRRRAIAAPRFDPYGMPVRRQPRSGAARPRRPALPNWPSWKARWRAWRRTSAPASDGRGAGDRLHRAPRAASQPVLWGNAAAPADIGRLRPRRGPSGNAITEPTCARQEPIRATRCHASAAAHAHLAVGGERHARFWVRTRPASRRSWGDAADVAGGDGPVGHEPVCRAGRGRRPQPSSLVPPREFTAARGTAQRRWCWE